MKQQMTATKAWIGGSASALASGILTAVEGYLMLDLPIESEAVIVAALTGAITTIMVYLFPNRPKELAI